jgi:hypothetical protein
MSGTGQDWTEVSGVHALVHSLTRPLLDSAIRDIGALDHVSMGRGIRFNVSRVETG